MDPDLSERALLPHGMPTRGRHAADRQPAARTERFIGSPRVAYVTWVPEGIGGAERLVLALLEAGERAGHAQVVLNLNHTASSSAFEQACSGFGYRAFCARGRWAPALMRRWLAAELRRLAPDIVHASLFAPALLVASLRRRRGQRRILTHVYGEGVTSLSHPRLRLFVDRFSCRRYDRVVAISGAVQRFLLETQRCPPRRVVRITPGWSGEPRPRRAGARPPTVISVARLRPEKGHRLLLAAFALVLEQEPSARLVLVGDGPLREDLENVVAREGMGESVLFTGSVREIWSELASADIFVLASETEAFGIAIVEAMAAGLPVVAPEVGAIPELVEPGVNGELFPPGQPDAMASLVVGLLRDRAARGRLAAGAVGTAEAHRRERTLERYLDLYAQELELSRAALAP